MPAIPYTPAPEYRQKLRLLVCTGAVTVIVLSGLVVTCIFSGIQQENGLTLVLVVGLGIWLVTLALVDARSIGLRYEVMDEGLVIQAGFWVRTVRFIPFRSIIAITSRQDLLDRKLFGLGTLKLTLDDPQGGSVLLVGLAETAAVHRMISEEVRRNGEYLQDGGTPPQLSWKGINERILVELQAIRQALEQGEE